MPTYRHPVDPAPPGLTCTHGPARQIALPHGLGVLIEHCGRPAAALVENVPTCTRHLTPAERAALARCTPHGAANAAASARAMIDHYPPPGRGR